MFKQILPLSLMISLRFFGLFIVLPMLSIYALDMKDSTPFLAGIIVGSYALTQAIFQIPFGMMSDKFGRKGTLLFGLIIFIIGSIICALSENIIYLLIGRFLQGAGAIGSVISAMISDIVKEEERSKAMAIMGGTIAISFALAMLFSPIIGASLGIDKLFWMTAILSIISIWILFVYVPEVPKITHTYMNKKKSTIKDLFKDKSLKSMYITFLFHSSIMTVAFFIIPIVLTSSIENNGFGWERSDLWKVYVPAMIFGLLAMGPSSVFGEKYGKGKEVFITSVLFILFGFIAIGFSSTDTIFVIGVICFFIGFNMFEPLLQSFVSKFSKVHQRGKSLGTANTFAYIGIFIGGLFAGKIIESFDREVLSLIIVSISIFWLIWIIKMPNLSSRGNVYMPLNIFDREKINLLENKNSIVEVYINESEKIIIVKYEKELIDEDQIRGILLKNKK